MKSEHFSDLHQHVLWGLDDGPQTRKQMHALLRQDAKDGVELVFATSHAYPKTTHFDLELYLKRLKEANRYCEKKGLSLRVLPGSEIHYCSAVADRLASGKLVPLGDSKYVLIEFSEDVRTGKIASAADSLYRAGYLPVVAHVERIRCLAKSPKYAIEMRNDYGLLFQMNCETVLHPRGFRQRRFVKYMLRERAIDVLATDAHDVRCRPVLMREAYQKIVREYGKRYARKLTRLGWKIAGLSPKK